MLERKAVITGLGVVSPAGRDLTDFFTNLLNGRGFSREIDRFDSSRYRARSACLIDWLDSDATFTKRLTKKLDRFSHMALLASDDALRRSGLELAREDMERIGVIIGNALGGWGFAEEELRDLYRHGLREVSPYQATAWFPAAPQGQISIHYGLKGFAKTIIADTASAHLAIGYAARAVLSGKADVVLTGGAEAPVSPYALLCCNTSGEMSASGMYRPFDRNRDGYVIGEGAGILVVEDLSHARARGAKVLAEIKGFSHTSDGFDPRLPDPAGSGMARAMRSALASAGTDAREIDYLMPAGLGGRESDAAEAKAVREVFGEGLNGSLSVGIPKALYGNLLGASGALDTAVACLAMDNGVAPTATCCAEPDAGCRWVNGKGLSVKKEINNVLINAMGRGGVNAALVLGKCV